MGASRTDLDEKNYSLGHCPSRCKWSLVASAHRSEARDRLSCFYCLQPLATSEYFNPSAFKDQISKASRKKGRQRKRVGRTNENLAYAIKFNFHFFGITQSYYYIKLPVICITTLLVAKGMAVAKIASDLFILSKGSFFSILILLHNNYTCSSFNF